METHVRILGYLHIALGAICALVGVVLLFVFGGLAAFAGASAASDPDAAMAAPFLGLLGGIFCIFLLVLAFPGVITGIGLLKFRPWARVVGIILSALELINFPFGTAIGIYGLWVLLSTATEPLFHPHPATQRPERAF